jgi:hypothetical protein
VVSSWKINHQIITPTNTKRPEWLGGITKIMAKTLAQEIPNRLGLATHPGKPIKEMKSVKAGKKLYSQCEHTGKNKSPMT